MGLVEWDDRRDPETGWWSGETGGTQRRGWWSGVTRGSVGSCQGFSSDASHHVFGGQLPAS